MKRQSCSMGWPKIWLSFSFPNYQDSDGHFKATSFSFLAHLIRLPLLSHWQSILMHTKKLFQFVTWRFKTLVPLTQSLISWRQTWWKEREFSCFPPSTFSTDKSWFLEWFWFGFGSKALCCKMNYSHILFIDSNSVWFIELVNEHLYIIVFFVWVFFVVSLCRMYVCVSVCI